MMTTQGTSVCPIVYSSTASAKPPDVELSCVAFRLLPLIFRQLPVSNLVHTKIAIDIW
jgi:hypothetical protein